jgi:benzoyl-CoA reductase subunit C
LQAKETAIQQLADIIEECRTVVEDPYFPAAREWMADNPDGKVVGHFQVYFPEELAHAAGMLPVKLMGADTSVQIGEADAHIAAFVCSILRTSLELVLTDRVDFLSMYVTHPICDAARHLNGIWTRRFPDMSCQILYLPHNATSGHAIAYLTAEYRRIAAIIEEISGNAITDEALATSIGVFNENRRLLRELYRIRRASPWQISLVDSYLLTRAAGVMPRERHNDLLRRALPLIEQQDNRPQDKIRVVFEGGFCEQPPIEMLSVLQDVAYVVDDDLLIGLRWLTEDVATAGDPVENLATSYLEASSYSPVQRDPRKPKEEMLLARIRDAGAEAAIVAAAKMCEPGLEEQVAYDDALTEAGIPHLIMEFEEKTANFEQVRMEVETFAESLLFEFV